MYNGSGSKVLLLQEAEAKGQVPKLARRAYYHNCGPAYTNIAELFMKGDIGRLRREVDAARTVWVHVGSRTNMWP